MVSNGDNMNRLEKAIQEKALGEKVLNDEITEINAEYQAKFAKLNWNMVLHWIGDGYAKEQSISSRGRQQWN